MASGSTVIGHTSRRAHWVLGGLALLYLALLGRSVSHGFVWDDRVNIVDNAYLGEDLWHGLFATQHDHMGADVTGRAAGRLAHDSFRPLLFLSYSLDVALFGKSAAAMHAHNLLLGLVLIGLAFRLARSLGRPEGEALAVTAIFAMHPLQVEPSAYVSARSDLLAGIFALAAMLWVLGGARRAQGRLCWAALAFASSFLGLWFKEGYLGLPLALGLLGAARGELRRMLPGLAATALASLLYVPCRLLLMGNETALPAGHHSLRGLFWLGAVGLDYLAKFVSPFGLGIERLYDPGGEWLGWMLALACIGYALWPARGATPAGPGRVAAATLSWVWLLVGPSAVVVSVQGVLADRYMHLATLGVALALGELLRAVRPLAGRVGRALDLALLGWGVALWAISWGLVGAWRDNLTLYEHAVAAEPTSAMAHYRLGFALSGLGRWPEAHARLLLAEQLDPDDPRILNNLAVVNMRLGRWAEAERNIERALAVSSAGHYRAWFNLGVVRDAQGRQAEACAAYARAVELSPGYAKARDAWQQRCDGGAPPAP